MESSVIYNAKTQSFYCPDCMETLEVRKKVAGDPEELLALTELVHLDHRECPGYKDVTMARQARKYRKEGARRKLLDQQSAPTESAGCFRA